MFGSRGVILVLVGYFMLRILFSYQIKFLLKCIYINITIILSFALISIVSNQVIILAIYNFLFKILGINSRTLLMILNNTMYGNFFSDSGRLKIIKSILNELKGYRVLTGLGINGDVVNSGTYSHNIFIQLISNFGYISGFLLILVIILICIKMLNNTKEAIKDVNLMIYRELFLVFFSFSMIQLQISASVYSSMEFYVMLALCFNCFDYNKKTIPNHSITK
jgi:O-antigen ligase